LQIKLWSKLLKFLALDLSLRDLVIVIAEDKQVFFSENINLNKNRAAVLFANLDHAMKSVGVDFSDLKFIFSTVGPGNFNGIRVSLSFIRGIALGTNAIAAGISTMECLARSINTTRNIGVIIKAYPEHFYVQWFDKMCTAITKPELMQINTNINIPLKSEDLILVGNGSSAFAEKLGFDGQIIDMQSPTSSGLLNSAKKEILKKKLRPPEPLYLRSFEATEPSRWKNSPIVR